MTRSPHILAAHELWKGLLCKTDTVIDATCGNGHDTLYLYHLLPKGQIYALDIQKKALENTEEKIKSVPPNGCQTRLLLSSHTEFPKEILPNSIKLIVYNLGYLPLGNKEITTKTESTLISLTKALDLLTSNGALSITLYPGHPEGEKEAFAVIEFAKNLSKNIWSIDHKIFQERKSAPSLLIITRLI